MVLLVEDEAAIRNATAEYLTMCGYRVLTACNGRDALGVAKDHPEIGIIVTDVVMPQMSGGQLLQEVRPILPRSRALFVSGHPGKTVVEHSVVKLESNFLQKPFSLKQLGRKVREVLDQPAVSATSG
jgi:DNA-binding NtrC family response regulator